MKKKFVSNQKGFLLIEHLIALFLTGLLAMVIVVLLQVIKNHQVNANQISQHEIETLATHLQKEIKKIDSISVSQEKINFHVNGSPTTSYYVQNKRLTRQVDGVGGEIALYHCQKMTIELLNDQSVRLEITSTYGDVFNIYLSTLTLPLEPVKTETSLKEMNLDD